MTLRFHVASLRVRLFFISNMKFNVNVEMKIFFFNETFSRIFTNMCIRLLYVFNLIKALCLTDSNNCITLLVILISARWQHQILIFANRTTIRERY